MVMEKESARSQTLEQLHERRKQVVRLYKQGTKVMEIVKMTGLSYPTVRSAIDLFEAGGWGAIRPALSGRTRGDGRVLSAAQEDTIQRMIIDKRPEQLKLDFSLWSRAAVGQLIEQEFGIKLAYEQSPAAVQAWLEGEYPASSNAPGQRGCLRPRVGSAAGGYVTNAIRRHPERDCSSHQVLWPVIAGPCAGLGKRRLKNAVFGIKIGVNGDLYRER